MTLLDIIIKWRVKIAHNTIWIEEHSKANSSLKAEREEQNRIYSEIIDDLKINQAEEILRNTN